MWFPMGPRWRRTACKDIDLGVCRGAATACSWDVVVARSSRAVVGASGRWPRVSRVRSKGPFSAVLSHGRNAGKRLRRVRAAVRELARPSGCEAGSPREGLSTAPTLRTSVRQTQRDRVRHPASVLWPLVQRNSSPLDSRQASSTTVCSRQATGLTGPSRPIELVTRQHGCSSVRRPRSP